MTGKRLAGAVFLAVAAGVVGLAWNSLRGSEAAGPVDSPTKPIRTVIVTGGHGFDQKAFPKLFEGHPDIVCEFKPQKDDSEIFEDVADWPYDVVVLYNMTQKISEKRRQNFLGLLDRGVGLVVLHHAVGAFQDWPEFEKIIGTRYYLKEMVVDGVTHPMCAYREGVDFTIHVEDPEHPITKGLADFQVRDEGYRKLPHAQDNHLLLSTDNAVSDKQIAWVRTYKNARVFCTVIGHGPQVFTSEPFRRIMARAIRWTAKRNVGRDDAAPTEAASGRTGHTGSSETKG
ncbi:MAG TPA: ThuA domain-containing protein [Phycisphaerae bacterium]|nr:ThuA domain-containing protein [Phycisphaerae bacterium]